jgi:hypothetical protein
MPCGLQTCPQGCCDSSGTCQPGTAVTACGNQGQHCKDCSTAPQKMCIPPNLHNLCL